jgi:hypothetical protein
VLVASVGTNEVMHAFPGTMIPKVFICDMFMERTVSFSILRLICYMEHLHSTMVHEIWNTNKCLEMVVMIYVTSVVVSSLNSGFSSKIEENHIL